MSLYQSAANDRILTNSQATSNNRNTKIAFQWQ
jgi:hypothetical protein